MLIGVEELSRVQAQAISDLRVASAVRQLLDSTAENVRDVTMLVHRQGSRPLPLAGLTRGVSWVTACLVTALGVQTALAFDRWLIERWVRAAQRSARWIPPDDGITLRALDAVREREASRLRALWGTRPQPPRSNPRRRGR